MADKAITISPSFHRYHPSSMIWGTSAEKFGERIALVDPYHNPPTRISYKQNPLATAQAIDDDVWLNTGDVGWVCPYHSVGRSRQAGGVIVLEGRAKDTIVLSTGENVEPSNIEEAAMRSSLIQQIMVIGQDQRRLGAVIVPNKEEILSEAKRLPILEHDSSELSKQKQVYQLHEELKKW